MSEETQVLIQNKVESLNLKTNKTPPKPRKRKPNDPLTQEEVAKLINNVIDLEEKTFLELGFNTGMRISEITNISLNNIDYEREVIRIWDEKKNLYRNVRPPSNTLKSVQLYLNTKEKQTELLFELSRKTGERIIQKWSNEVLGREISWHCVRHTYITISHLLGQDIKVVQANTGDSITTLLKTYTTTPPQKMRELVNEKAIYKRLGSGT